MNDFAPPFLPTVIGSAVVTAKSFGAAPLKPMEVMVMSPLPLLVTPMDKGRLVVPTSWFGENVSEVGL